MVNNYGRSICTPKQITFSKEPVKKKHKILKKMECIAAATSGMNQKCRKIKAKKNYNNLYEEKSLVKRWLLMMQDNGRG